MRTLTTSDLLTLWERGHALHPLDRALLVLGAALPGTASDALADWPLGKRNTALAALRVATFGPRLAGWSACTACGEKLEFDVDGTLLTHNPAASQFLTVDERAFRLPTTRDLARVAGEQDPSTAAMRLLEACRLDLGDEPLTEHDLEAVGERMAAADPMAEILLDLPCPTCGHEGNATLDLIAFLWAELEVRAKRLLLDVHRLASAYGWSEPAILALSEPRRAFYLDLVRA